MLAQECMGLLRKQHQSPDAAGRLGTWFSIRFVASSSSASGHPNGSLRIKSLSKMVQRGGRGNGDSAFELALLQRKQSMDQNPESSKEIKHCRDKLKYTFSLALQDFTDL